MAKNAINNGSVQNFFLYGLFCLYISSVLRAGSIEDFTKPSGVGAALPKPEGFFIHRFFPGFIHPLSE